MLSFFNYFELPLFEGFQGNKKIIRDPKTGKEYEISKLALKINGKQVMINIKRDVKKDELIFLNKKKNKDEKKEKK